MRVVVFVMFAPPLKTLSCLLPRFRPVAPACQDDRMVLNAGWPSIASAAQGLARITR
jgi:hypothetical protein